MDCWTGGIQFDLTWKGCGSLFWPWNMYWRRILLANCSKSRKSCRLIMVLFVTGVGINFRPLDSTFTWSTTTTVESHKMAAILQITGWQRDMQPWFTAYFVGIGHPCYDQLTPVKTRYPLTSITWPYCGLKLTAHQGQVFFLKVTADQVLVFRLDRGLMSG